MSAEKTLEVKVRALPGQERQDQKDVSRVYFAKEALLELKLEAGQVCELWKAEDAEPVKRQAIAWPSGQKLNKNVVQMFKTFQEACGFKLEDRIAIAAVGALPLAESVLLKDITTEDVAPLSEDDVVHWEWFLKENLGRAETIFAGMIFRISLRGPRRVLQVQSVLAGNSASSSSAAIGKFTETTLVKIVKDVTDTQDTTVNTPSKVLQITGIPGLSQALQKLNKSLATFSYDRRIATSNRSAAILIHGGSGTGKTFILEKLMNLGWGRVFTVDRETSIPNLQQIFRDAKFCKNSIIVIDDLDILTSREHGRAGFEFALSKELDSLSKNTLNPKVLVIATAKLLSDVPQHLQKSHRFRIEISLPVPDVHARKEILRFFANESFPSSTAGGTKPLDELLDKLGERTHAYTAEDLLSLWWEACDAAEERLRALEATIPDPEIKAVLTQADIDHALLAVRPSAMHDITLQPPKVRWTDIGGQEAMKKALRKAIEEPLLHPERLIRLGGRPKRGLLLYGPPGCSKTLSAAACATELSHNFFAVKGPELLNMYVGESERAVRAVFARARAAAPSIIFFDEIESIATARRGVGSSKSSGGASSGVQTLSTLLNEMDGIESLNGVIVLAATNVPQDLDLAILRPGRFDELLYVPPPSYADRLDILRLRTRAMDTADDVDLEQIAAATEGFSGAEVVAVCLKAVDFATTRCYDTGREDQVEMRDFVRASTGKEAVKSKITRKMVRDYERWAEGVQGTKAPSSKMVEDENGGDDQDQDGDGEWVDEP